MELQVKKAPNRAEAIKVIEAQTYKVVELDYPDGGADVIELGRLGRKYRVGVMFLSQMAVVAKNEFALQEKLSQPKNTFKQRFIHLDFDLVDSDLQAYQKTASLNGDLIVPKGFMPIPSETGV